MSVRRDVVFVFDVDNTLLTILEEVLRLRRGSPAGS